MAKGNLFQGMARGKVGDVVFSRLDGQQVSRVRNRAPRNPRTNAQLMQRAIMATIMQAYSQGKEIFDHSFQGKVVGSGCQRRFMELNTKMLRAGIAYNIDHNTALADQNYRTIAPKIKTSVPNKYIVSEGTYDNDLLAADGTFKHAPLENETIAQYCERNRIIAGDYYTWLGFALDQFNEDLFVVDGSTADYGTLKTCHFFFVRMKVKESALTDETIMTENTMKNKFFTVDKTAGVGSIGGIGVQKIGDPMVNGYDYFDEDYTQGVIRSRLDQDLRSECTLEIPAAGLESGIVSTYVLDAWKQGTQNLGDSDLILEGGQGF